MNATAASPTLPRPAVPPAHPPRAEAAPAGRSPSFFVSFLAGALTPFTVPLVGEMPVGEAVLAAVAAWAGLCVVFHRRAPGPLFRLRYFRGLLAGQAVAFLAYVVSDLCRHSTVHDMMRGWGRLAFVALDLVALAYLFGRSRRNFIAFLIGQQLGAVVAALWFGALFGDFWKFGIGIPLTFAVVLLASLVGRLGVVLAATGLCLLHFAQDFRSVGGLCLLLAAGSALQGVPARLRRAALPAGALAALLALAAIQAHAQRHTDAHRATRSDVDRSSMLLAAGEAFLDSPLLGHGSWFSRSDVYENFLLIRDAAAHEADVGGFAGANEEDTETVALHSQLLVALAEGGIFGATFFFVFGAGVLWALRHLVFARGPARVDTAAIMLYLLFAAWNLAMSPFSGAHRVAIAASAGLVLLLQFEPVETDAAPEAAAA